MYVRLSGLALCLALLSIGCQSERRVPPNNLGQLIDGDPYSGDVVAEPLVTFTDLPEYNDDQLTFKVEAKNEAASSFVYAFMHGENLSCNNSALTWEHGNFDAIIEITDSNASGKRLICIRGVDAEGKMSEVVVPSPFKKPDQYEAEANVDITFSITNGIMSVSKPASSTATGFKWCVIDAEEECPMPNDSDQYEDAGNCTFTAGTSLPQNNIDLGIGVGTFIACVVGIGGDKHAPLLDSDPFKKDGQQQVTTTQPDPPQPTAASYPQNNGKLVASTPNRIGYYVMGKSQCSGYPYFKNDGTEEITVKFNYLRDSGRNQERRETMFSDIVYQVYPIASHTQVKQALGNSYCRHGEPGAGKVLNDGDTFTIPAGHRVITIFKAKDPTSMHHAAKYFTTWGYACIQMRLTDLNNSTDIDKYRCVRRSELELYKGSNKLEKTNGEYNVELSRNPNKGNRHLRFNVVNATIEKAIAAGRSREDVERLYNNDLTWKLVGYTGENVPNWLYYLNENFTKTKDDGRKEKITGENQFQIGLRMSKIKANGNGITLPNAGAKYRFLLLSNSLSDSPCQESPPVTYITKQDSGQGENRREQVERFWFCPRADVLNITIIDPQ